jgi:hypothetical protein
MTLLDELRAREVALHHSGVRSSRERLEALLHPAFHEVGRSGRTYDRDTCITFLLSEKLPLNTVSDRFAAEPLQAGLALLTYRSAQRAENGGWHMHTLRMSLWQQTEAGWQLRYHQGTPAAEPWEPPSA